MRSAGSSPRGGGSAVGAERGTGVLWAVFCRFSIARRTVNAVTAAIATSGKTSAALDPNSRIVRATELSGIFIEAEAKAAMPTASPPASPSPGSGARSAPKAPPSMIDGKIAPPRKEPRDRA